MNLLQQYNEKKITEAQMIERLQQNYADFSKTHGITISLYGQGGKAHLSAASQSQNEARSQTKFTQQLAKAEQDQAAAKSGLVNQEVKNQAELEVKSREAKEKMDRALENFMEPLGKAMVGMLNVVDDLVDGIRGLLGWFLGKEPDQRRATQESVAAAETQLAKDMAKLQEQKDKIAKDQNQANLKANQELLETLTRQVESSREAVDNEKKLLEEGTAEERRQRRRAQREQGAAYPSMPGPGGTAAAGQPPAQTKTGQPATSASQQATEMIVQFEKFTPKAHFDFKQYSIGYGTKTTDPDEIAGRKTITPAEGQSRMASQIGQIVPKIVAAGQARQWGQNQVDAMTSFAYNLGVGAISKVTNNGRRSNQETADAMLQYNKAGGRVLPILVRRREAERALFLKDMPMLAQGGIATKPSIAGEAGAEAVIPITDGRVHVDLGDSARRLVAMDQEQASEAKNAGTRTGATMNLDQVVTDAVNQIMQSTDVENEMLGLLQSISRANRATTDNNRRFYRNRAN